MAGAEDRNPEPKATRRPRVVALLSFLGVFVLLLVLFRSVLFPFLIAIFLAYLVEPVVGWVSRSRLLGLRWTRGPTILLLFVVVIGGLSVAAWFGVTKTAKSVQRTGETLVREMRRPGGRLLLLLQEPLPPGEDLVLAAGSRLSDPSAPGVWVTLHEARLEPGDTSTWALLVPEAVDTSRASPLPEGTPLRLLSTGSGPRRDDGQPPPPHEFRAGAPPHGVELLIERRLIGPIVRNLAKAGFDVEPTEVRAFVDVKARALTTDLPDRVARGAVHLAGKIVLSVYEFFLILMITAFLVMDRRVIAAFFRQLPPAKNRPAYDTLIRYVDRGLAGVIRGQLMICAVNGVLTWIGLTLLGVKGALLLSALAAILSLIPIFGTIISSIPIVLIAFTDGMEKALLALGWIAGIHVLEANLFNPLIMGGHARMHPVVIIFALLAGEHTYGVWGALLAVPAASILQSCLLFYLYEVEGMERPPLKPPRKGALGNLFRRLGFGSGAAGGGQAGS